MVGLGADRRRVDQDLGAGERVGARELREPLVPAGRAAEPGRRPAGRAATATAGMRRPRPGPDGSSGPRSSPPSRGCAACASAPRASRRARRRSRCCNRDRHRRPPARTATRARTPRARARSRRANLNVGPLSSPPASPPAARALVGDREVARQGQLLEADDPRALRAPRARSRRRAPPRARRGRVPALLDETEPQRRALGGRVRAGDSGTRKAVISSGASERGGTCWVMQCGPPPP